MTSESLPFGKHLDAWESFAREIGGVCNAPKTGTSARIEVPHARGPIVIEGHAGMSFVAKVPVQVLSTKFSARLTSTPARRFSVARASFTASVAEFFGALDIHVDDEVFDRAFVLKGDTPDLVRELFASAPLRERYLRDFEGQLYRLNDHTIFGDPTPNADPFELTVPDFVDTPARLRALWELFIETLNRLPD